MLLFINLAHRKCSSALVLSSLLYIGRRIQELELLNIDGVISFWLYSNNPFRKTMVLPRSGIVLVTQRGVLLQNILQCLTHIYIFSLALYCDMFVGQPWLIQPEWIRKSLIVVKFLPYIGAFHSVTYWNKRFNEVFLFIYLFFFPRGDFTS